jgi:hypothetical protein
MKTTPPEPPSKAVFHKVAQNWYRLESSRRYYALFKRAGKQIRRSLKTTDPLLARRRLKEFGSKVSRRSLSLPASRFGLTTILVQATWPSWFGTIRSFLPAKPSSCAGCFTDWRLTCF